MKRKNILHVYTAVLVIVIMLLTAACSKSESNGNNGDSAEIEKNTKTESTSAVPTEDWINERISENIEGLTQLASDENLCKLMSGSADIMTIIQNWSKASMGNSADRLSMKFSRENLNMLMGMGETAVELSRFAEDYLVNRLPNTIPSVLNSQVSTMSVAANGVVNYTKSYVAPCEMENVLYFVPSTQAGTAYAVSFLNSGEGVITVNTCYISYNASMTLKDALSAMLPMFTIE